MTGRLIAYNLPAGKKAIYSTGPDVAKKSQASQYRHKATERASNQKQSFLSAVYFSSRSTSISASAMSLPSSSAISQYTISDQVSTPDIIELVSSDSGVEDLGDVNEPLSLGEEVAAEGQDPGHGPHWAAKAAAVALRHLHRFVQELTEELGQPEDADSEEGMDDEAQCLIAGVICLVKTQDTNPVKPWPAI